MVDQTRLTLRGRVERAICVDHLGGPCELSKRITATAIDEMAVWLAEIAQEASELAAVDGERESVHATALNALAEEAKR